MLSVHSPKHVVRAAAVLTNSAVGSSPIAVGATLDGFIGVQIDFTLGSLTNGLFDPQVSNDGTNWYSLTTPGVLTLTANGTKAFNVCAKGFKLFRVAVTGTGTVTSSSATVQCGYQVAGGALA